MTHNELFPKVTVGLDLGDKTSRVYAINAAGQRVDERMVHTTTTALRRYFATESGWRIVLEIGTHSRWVAALLTDLGHEALVANPSAMYGARRRRKRNDQLDAEFLARQGRADPQLLHPIRHRGQRAQEHLAMLRARDQVVRARTQLINHVRGTVKAHGSRLSKCSADAFARRAAPEVPEALGPVVAPLLELIGRMNSQIREYDRAIGQLVRTTYPVAQRLQQPTGVGPLTALAFVLLIEDPTRFAKSRDVGAYFGLVPRLDESSASRPQLRISKAGDALGRRYLVGAAQYILGPFGPPCNLRRHGEGIAARGGKNAKKRAVVAVARKLAVMLHHLWLSEQAYDPQYGRTVTAA